MSKKGYNPNQPRVPAGSSTGGQWTSDGSNAAIAAREAAGLEVQTKDMGGLISALKENGGFSQSLQGESPTSGYMCSISNEQYAIPLDDITGDDIIGFVQKNWDNLLKDGYYLGGWVDPINGVDHVYLDISENIQSLDEVMKKALEREQLGVYDLVNNRTIDVQKYWKDKKSGRFN